MPLLIMPNIPIITQDDDQVSPVYSFKERVKGEIDDLHNDLKSRKERKEDQERSRLSKTILDPDIDAWGEIRSILGANCSTYYKWQCLQGRNLVGPIISQDENLLNYVESYFNKKDDKDLCWRSADPTWALGELVFSFNSLWDFLNIDHVDLDKDLPKFEVANVLRLCNKLCLENCRLTNGHIYKMLQSPYVSNLRHLSLRGNRLDAWGVLEIANCPYLSKLEYLDVGNNRIKSDRKSLKKEVYRLLPNLKELLMDGQNNE